MDAAHPGLVEPQPLHLLEVQLLERLVEALVDRPQLLHLAHEFILARETPSRVPRCAAVESAMVRPQEGGSSRRGQPLTRCTDPAGANPVPVSTGAPGSRPQAREETFVSQAGRQE